MAVTAVMAQFKTAYLQREIPVKATLAADLKVGQVCTFSGVDGSALAGKTSAPAVGDYIVAQSDMTMGDSHVPVEQRNYNYSDKVAASTTAKLVALYRINDLTDITYRTV